MQKVLMVIGSYEGKGDQGCWISCPDIMAAVHIQFCDFCSLNFIKKNQVTVSQCRMFLNFKGQS